MRFFAHLFRTLCLCCLLIGNTAAQTGFHATAKTDSVRMLIGDQTKLHLTLSGNSLPNTLFPSPCDTCLPGLEIVGRSRIDTQRDNGSCLLTQTWTLTGFDSGHFEIPAFAFYGTDSTLLATTQAIPLDIHTLAVDTAGNIKDIKQNLQAPLTWKEIGKYALLVLLGIALLCGLLYAILRLKPRKKEPLRPAKPAEPAHVIALRALEGLRQKKLWQAGLHKQYYSELSDILRTYLYHRWDIPAMEMVSEEILRALEDVPVTAKSLHDLSFTLHTADTVKFAKACPLPDENSQAFESVRVFVEETRETLSANTPKEGEKSHA